mmetsp:Transcript_23842/g.45494  ORF Transcript_23842/g.45494 Transcript_23842/m.45494 type:complete len:259 (-) Transcript_23842:153-929(-)
MTTATTMVPRRKRITMETSTTMMMTMMLPCHLFDWWRPIHARMPTSTRGATSRNTPRMVALRWTYVRRRRNPIPFHPSRKWNTAHRQPRRNTIARRIIATVGDWRTIPICPHLTSRETSTGYSRRKDEKATKTETTAMMATTWMRRMPTTCCSCATPPATLCTYRENGTPRRWGINSATRMGIRVLRGGNGARGFTLRFRSWGRKPWRAAVVIVRMMMMMQWWGRWRIWWLERGTNPRADFALGRGRTGRHKFTSGLW